MGSRNTETKALAWSSHAHQPLKLNNSTQQTKQLKLNKRALILSW